MHRHVSAIDNELSVRQSLINLTQMNVSLLFNIPAVKSEQAALPFMT
jgi:hypothetical protein